MALTCAVAILNYNGLQHLQNFLPQVVQNSATSTQIVVIDNASTDGSKEYVTTNFTHVQWVQLKQNHGFAGGYNKGLKDIKAHVFILLNNDVAVTPNWDLSLLEIFNNTAISAAQPKIRAYNKPSYFEYAGAAGGFIDYLGYPFCQGRLFHTLEIDQDQYKQSKQIFWATGACMAVRAEQFHGLGGFDQSFFAHMEEIDLCWRLQLAGGQIWYNATSTVYHLGAGTLAKNNPYKTFLNFRNSLFMLLKNVEGAKVYPLLFLRMALDGIAALQFLAKGEFANFKAIFSSHIAFYKALPRVLKQRTEIQATKTNSPKNTIYRKSILWAYFAKRKTKFTDLRWRLS
jgi:GT2 family glycosyltransferase